MTHRRIKRIAGGAVVGLGMLALLGCLKREETIRIEPDGTAHLQMVFNGNPDDVRTGDAMLEDPGPWEVKDAIETDNDGDEDLTRTATLTVPPGEEFPTHFAGDDTELADLCLAMSTSLEIEERSDGTYYHFRRVYHRRDWARIDYFRRKFVEDSLKKLEEEDFAELNETGQWQIARDLLDLEGLKTLVLAEAAAKAVEPPLRQDDRLAIHQVIAGVFREVDTDRVVKILLLDDDLKDAEIAGAVQEVRDELERKINEVLSARDPAGTLGRVFMDQFERERRRYAISEDLADERWKVVVELPGRILGHNSLAGDPDDGEVRWEFDGDALYDRDEVLLATSVVERD